MRLFLEVFPTLKIESKLKSLLHNVSVTSVKTSSNHQNYTITLKSKHLIFSQNIEQIEVEIWKQLLKNHGCKLVKIEVNYELSAQYKIQNLWEEYQESFLYDLDKQSRFMGNTLRNGELDFKENESISLVVLQDIYGQQFGPEIVKRLKQMYKEILKLDLEISLAYKEAIEIDYTKENEKLIEIATRNITSKINRVKETSEETSEETSSNDNISKQKPKDEKKKSFYKTPIKRSNDPNLIYGSDFEDDFIALSEVVSEMGEISFKGQVINIEIREIRNEKSILMYDITDFTDTIRVKMFVKNEQLGTILEEVSKGKFLKIKGLTEFDTYQNELVVGSIKGIKRAIDFREKRMDTAQLKRVELHCHTKMSSMDGVSDVADIVKCAHSWGHQGIAITDHGGVQSHTVANHVMHDIHRKDKNDPFKVIYGMEGYIVDDLSDIVVNAGNQTLEDTFIVFDIETTGFSAIKDKIIEIGAVKVVKGEVVDTYSTFVNPQRPIPYKIEELTGIKDEMVLDAPVIEEVLDDFLKFVGDGILVAHNASFDVGFIEQNCRYQDIVPDFISLDTVALARVLLPQLGRYKLDRVAKELKINLENHHRAVDDADATAKIFLKFIEMLREKHIYDLKGLNSFGAMNPDAIRKLPMYHGIILAKNMVGRKNLYKLVSMSHLKYFGRKPRIPKSLLNEYREGLIIGSACEAGELYQAIVREKSPETIIKLCEFYDYFEIQPRGNNQFMIDSPKYSNIESISDLEKINKKIVALGEEYKKPVVATCDVHFLNPEDEVYRAMIQAQQKFSDFDKQPPLYLHTTEEMLEEFSYLGSKKAFEVVVTNTNLIADMVENISPVRPDKCPPVIENSDQELRDICYQKAYKLYGENLPEIVVARLERELNSIISNGYSVMYIISQKLVWKSMEEGYLVGSRGSVGSSFVATMSGITEVNPLSPHYRCEHCFYSDFESEEVKGYAGSCGWDMPNKDCPDCGKPLMKDGFDIPFETFLGFKGNKEPDIDLNFSGEYQAQAHKYTEVLFGEGYTFKAGTIGTIADKTAYGIARGYYTDKNITKRSREIERMAKGCTKIRRSTGQHPGGIIVVPRDEEIYSFTPIQHPADDSKSGIITTHFDYHSIDHNLLKLDILGHDDPTIIKVLEELVEQLTGNVFDATKIPLDDEGVMGLFAGTDVLGIKPADIGGTPVGCLGVPEFGTDFVIQMVVDAKPKSISDLIRISGLSHGTDVWLGNAQTLIQDGIATISTAICTRDDIMTYLINQGVDSELSFTIMESVRKGKGLTPGWKEAMEGANVPQWYMESCEKIQYMFPKAHAAAYVMMAYRIAYCKVYYPLAYYAAYFSIRANAFSYELMCQGKSKVDHYIKQLKSATEKLTSKEEDTLKDLRLVQEMYARGFGFHKMDIFVSKAQMFQIIDGKLMPPLSSIDGMGEKAAQSVEDAAKDGVYISKEDFKQRTGATASVIEKMAEFELFGDIPDSNQYSLFDM